MAVVSTRILSLSGASSTLTIILICLLITKPVSSTAQNDLDCLKQIKNSLEDPLGYLASWDFSNTSGTSICTFIGIECWHANDNKVLSIKLPDMGLKGEFPLGISGCESLTGLDLSRNSIRGSIPRNISKLFPFAVSLDLSSNQLSGEIPVDLANCSYLNVLKLDNNQLSGQIPLEMGRLVRIQTFNVANNRLSGPVPTFAHASEVDYGNNAGLCGGVGLPRCG